MPIRVTLDRMLLERRMSLTELCDRVGITMANLSILKTGKAKAVRFSTLEALCKELGCQPGDLLSFDEDDEDADQDAAE
ncbi:MAG: helix-turn-helix transcriptional regulator [Alphaproteobacteria bacterium]|nr:helix-turn-helix transcriptional regulator [Alphaproteobacteria bacterium]